MFDWSRTRLSRIIMCMPGERQREMEEAVLTVEIAITRHGDGRYVARLGFDEQPGWELCQAQSARAAFERAGALAARRVSGAAGSLDLA
jgi:hypothetical protein